VGTASELAYHLAVLLSTAGQRACLHCGALTMVRGPASQQAWECPQCGATAPLAKPQHFSPSTYAAACLKCNGVGSLVVPRPEKLIIHPEKPLVEGAMYSPGFFPNGYLGKLFNHGYYQVLALGQRYGFDPHTTPWQEMTPAAQQAFLFGDPEPLQVTAYGHTGLVRTGMVKFPGFYGFLRDWDVGGAYSASLQHPRPVANAAAPAGGNPGRVGPPRRPASAGLRQPGHCSPPPGFPLPGRPGLFASQPGSRDALRRRGAAHPPGRVARQRADLADSLAG
ncbi:MAG: hypothetical protein ABSE06_21865, partial [Anaerolineaceae bacterium]